MILAMLSSIGIKAFISTIKIHVTDNENCFLVRMQTISDKINLVTISHYAQGIKRLMAYLTAKL